jgi:glutathione synthase/RimK-type ligase-like ATP-grasp enzyme
MLTTLFITPDNASLDAGELSLLTFNDYLHDYPKLGEPKLRVINLCDTEAYLSQGYYCSLLAEARQHQVLPSIRVINALRGGDVSIWLNRKAAEALAEFDDNNQGHVICMGETAEPALKKLAAKVFGQFPAPLLKVFLHREQAGIRVSIEACPQADLSADQWQFCLQVLSGYASAGWRTKGRDKKYRWDIAMLVDNDDKVPPSNKGALSRFIKAGEKLGLKVHPVEISDIHNINQFDGLFIRETTAIDHHTYRLACRAEEQGLVVMDDPNSILRCCNKVFLHDAFHYQKVPSLKTQFVSESSEQTLAQLERDFGLPLVLKMPEGSFSKGVYKVSDSQELADTVKKLLQQSALVLAQQYCFTDFDWRVGVLNGRAIYACRYYMARNHWQIYNHSSKRNFSGGFDTLPTFELPKSVLNAALKAAAVVGKGLYGIDLKEIDGKAYVLEVNDNPSIDHGVEDGYLGEELYMQVMSEFLRRLEARGR